MQRILRKIYEFCEKSIKKIENKKKWFWILGLGVKNFWVLGMGVGVINPHDLTFLLSEISDLKKILNSGH